MALTVAQKLNIAKICQYLVTGAIAKGGLFAKGIDQNLAMKIYNIRKAIQYRYETDPSDSTLEGTSNYLYGLCRFVLQAQAITQTAGTISGIVATTGSPQPYQFIVDASTTFIIDGQSSKTISAFIGYNLMFVRGGITQSTVSTEPSYFSWSSTTGVFVCTPQAYTGELFILYAI